MQKKILFAAALLIGSFIAVQPYVFSNFNGAQGHVAGAPGESNCTSCHNSYALNSGGGNTSIKIKDGETEVTEYIEGKQYNVEVTVTQAGMKGFGFQATIKGNNGQIGEFSNVTGENSVMKPDDNDQYATHIGAGQQTDSRTWIFPWTAPGDGRHELTFYVAGNAANLDFTPAGDYIYTSNRTLQPSALSLDKEALFEANISMYPNPVQHILNIGYSPPANGDKNVAVSIFNVDGELVKMQQYQSKAFSNNIIYADFSGFPKGTYMVKISSGNYSAVKKIFKQ